MENCTENVTFYLRKEQYKSIYISAFIFKKNKVNKYEERDGTRRQYKLNLDFFEYTLLSCFSFETM